MLPSKVTVTPTTKKPLTRAQKLSKALQSCRKQFKHNKAKRSACEKGARKRYGAKKASANRSKKASVPARRSR